MTINNVGDSAQVLEQYQNNNKENTKNTDNELGRDAFLELMVAQLKNQNPLKPTDNQAFVAQLAQFSTVEGIGQLNDTTDSLASKFSSASALQASSMVGQNVIVEGNQNGLLLHNGIVSGYTEVPGSASNMELRIEDENGQLLERFSLGARGEGPMSVRWDGLNLMVDGEVVQFDASKLNRQEYLKDEDGEFVTDDNGNKIMVPYPPGEYKFNVSATVAGQSEQLGMEMSSRVDSVTMGPGGQVTLNLTGGQKAGMDQIKQVLSS
ncbi:flagellar hook assembly protein FlgD [Bacterioplanoides sp. SCSIO 12839]|uniref:flagellar hook assembly protein FlgD n=1 Tax=Bacterioplanoides sp. SCSIO 12839 TaxID=2829569 RepID=UPI002105D55B|nr:flagellar hook capping FlgD N-terminal domain-containing protein [Bacterioplanoides sp. SCSIO 12839]UTW47308.1 flagellar hook assembly protein FlgD [Bacterioplanoides sp. SCSIO 12839]